VSYHQKKRRCSFCGAVGRNVTWFPLMGAFLHRECWLTETHLNLTEAMFGRAKKRATDYDANGSTPDPLEDPNPNHPFKLTQTEKDRNWDLFD